MNVTNEIPAGSDTGVDLSQVPRHVLEALATAADCGKWMISIFSCQDGRVNLDRFTQEFPRAEVDTAVNLFLDDVHQIKTGG